MCTLVVTQATANGQGEAEAEDGVQRIHVWSINAHAKDLLNETLEEFNQTIGQEKGIVADLKIIGGGNYWDTLEVAFAAGEEPHIAGTYENTPQYADAGWLVPLTEFEGGEEFVADYREFLVPNNNVYQGETYTLPYNVQTSRLVYNKELFERYGIVDAEGEARPPQTWAEMREAARIITEESDGEAFGFVMPLGWPMVPMWEIFNTFASSVGHNGWDVAAGEFRYADFAPAIEMLIEMQNDGAWFPGYTNITNDNARAMFSEGKIGMKFAMGWDVGVYTDQFPATMEWGVCRVPTPTAEREYEDYMRVGGSYAVTRNGGETGEAAFEVLKALYRNETLAELFEEQKFLPYNPAVLDLVEDEPENEAWVEFGDVRNHFVEIPSPSAHLRIVGDNVFQTTIVLLVEGDTSAVRPALEEVDRRYNAALQDAVDRGFDLDSHVNPDWSARVE